MREPSQNPAGDVAHGGSGTFSQALLTDLYELTMLEAYFEERMHETAVFSLFVRRLPERRNYLLACGLDSVLAFLDTLHFDEAALAYLDSLGRFSDRFLRHLAALRFTGDVYAVPEGTPIFPPEPIVEVAAPIAEAQLVEAFVMNQIHLQTVLASKAVRVVEAAQGRQVVDFGLRRMHGIDAGLKAARAFHVAGVDATSNVAAGQAYGLRVAGTLAHSYIQAHDDEYEAFRAFARLYPDTVLLVDTYGAGRGRLLVASGGRPGTVSARAAVRCRSSSARIHNVELGCASKDLAGPAEYSTLAPPAQPANRPEYQVSAAPSTRVIRHLTCSHAEHRSRSVA